MGRIAILFLAALVAAGCGERSRQADIRVVSVPPEQVTTRIIGAAPGQQAVLREILAGIGPTRVQTVRLVEPEKAMRAPPGSVALNLRIPLNDRRAYWHARLIADAFYRRSREGGLPRVVFFTAGSGGWALGKDPYLERQARGPGMSIEQAREIAEQVRKEATESGVEVQRLDLLRPRRWAFDVVLEVRDPASFLRYRYEDVTRPLDELARHGYDQQSVEVLDREGETVIARGGWGSVREDVGACPRLITGFDFEPPPCPVVPRWARWRRSF